MNEWLNIIGNVGFPIAVSAYLLIRIEGRLAELTSAIGELREAIIIMPAAPLNYPGRRAAINSEKPSHEAAGPPS